MSKKTTSLQPLLPSIPDDEFMDSDEWAEFIDSELHKQINFMMEFLKLKLSNVANIDVREDKEQAYNVSYLASKSIEISYNNVCLADIDYVVNKNDLRTSTTLKIYMHKVVEFKMFDIVPLLIRGIRQIECPSQIVSIGPVESLKA